MDLGFAEVVAVIALLVAVWAVVSQQQQHSRLQDEVRSLWGYQGEDELNIHDHDARLRALEESVEEIDPSRTRHAIEWHGLDARLRALEEGGERIDLRLIHLESNVFTDESASETGSDNTMLRKTIPLLRAGGSKPEIRNVEGEE